jgi:hypothetical protein
VSILSLGVAAVILFSQIMMGIVLFVVGTVVITCLYLTPLFFATGGSMDDILALLESFSRAWENKRQRL